MAFVDGEILTAQALNQALDDLKHEDTGWVELDLSWQNASSTLYARVKNGVCFLEMSVGPSSGSIGANTTTKVATLPAWARPARGVTAPAAGNVAGAAQPYGHACGTYIAPNGEITIYVLTQALTRVYVQGISYPVAV